MTQTREQWVEAMVAFMGRWLAKPGSDGVAFTAEFFSVVAWGEGYEDISDLRGWGAVFSRAKRIGLIKPLMVDGERVTALTQARHRTPLWVRA